MRANATFLIAICLLATAFAADCALGATIASDDASYSAYADGWQIGDDGGTGFRPWTLPYSGVLTGLFHTPQFIARAPLSGNLLGMPAFGLTTSDRDTFTDTSEAVRTFNVPIGVGQTLSVDLDGSDLGSGGRPFSRGNTFQLLRSNGQERFALYTSNRFNDDNWSTHRDVNTGVPAGSAFRVNFTLLTANTYNLSILPIGGGSPLFTETGALLAGTVNTDITQLRISAYATGSSANGSKELFFRNLMVTSPGLSGDYNGNGVVDAADYVVWRKTGGTPAGYNTWRSHFRETANASAIASSATTTAPEPSTLFLLIFALYWLSHGIKRSPIVSSVQTAR